MHTKAEIETTIRKALDKVVKCGDIDENSCLLDKEAKIIPSNFIYIFDEIEHMLDLPVCKIFENNTYEVMTVKNLTEAIYKLM